MVSCPFEGECTYARNEEEHTVRTCVENGTVAVLDYSGDDPCTAGSTVTTNVYASDGSLCYKTVRTPGPACETSTAVWFDAVDNQIATESVTYPSGNTTIVCTEGGASATCARPCYTLSPPCSAGDCPSPP
jgi:hypothetical protein